VFVVVPLQLQGLQRWRLILQVWRVGKLLMPAHGIMTMVGKEGRKEGSNPLFLHFLVIWGDGCYVWVMMMVFVAWCGWK